jgi:hypothetical protein
VYQFNVMFEAERLQSLGGDIVFDSFVQTIFVFEWGPRY